VRPGWLSSPPGCLQELRPSLREKKHPQSFFEGGYMDRRTFLQLGAGAATFGALGALPGVASATSFTLRETTTQRALFDALPVPRPGQWVRFILGSGVSYQKQIGVGTESGDDGELFYYETQVGTPGGSCNPNTLKRTYLRASKFVSLIDPVPVAAQVATSGTALTRWADVEGGQPQSRTDKTLRLLDAQYLYDDRPLRVVARTAELLPVPTSSVYSGSAGSSRRPLRARNTLHTVAEFGRPYDALHQLTRIELWTTPDVPFGVVKYRALVKDEEPFELRLYSYGTRFKTDLGMSLKTIRGLTPNGTYIQTG
jgi:hypothetical protein